MLLPNHLKSVALSAFFIVAVACSSEKEATQTVADSPVHTLIFLDKTQSVNVNKAFVNQKYQQAIGDIVEENMRNKGDKLEVYFIHENTSKSRALSLTIHSEKDNTENTSATDKEAIETAFQLSLQKEKSIFLRQTLNKLHQQNNGSSNQTTDIWASLPVIAKAGEGGSEVRVYYFSDMVESVKGANRRDFHIHPPSSDSQAEEWAKADIKQVEKYSIGSPSVTIISPFEPTASTKENNPSVTYYWQTLFQDLAGVAIEEL